MDETMIMRQREIGKQQMLVKILHYENDRRGHSFVSRDDLVGWTSMSEDELETFISFCSALDPYSIADETANNCRREEKFKNESESYIYILSACYRFGGLFASILDPDLLEEYVEEYAAVNYRIYKEKYGETYPVDKFMAAPDVFKHMMQSYIKCYLDNMDEALSAGYDWDVIAKMTRDNISEKRYQVLVKAFRK